MRLAILFFAVLCLGGCLLGCTAMQPTAFTKEFSDSARMVATSISDQAVWDRVLARLNGQVIDPGVEAYAGILYVAGGKVRGVSGQVSIEGDGTGSGQLSPEARAVIVELGRNPDLAKVLAERMAMWKAEQPASAPSTP